MEEEFDRMGIRYIAIMDNIDTKNGISDLVPMQDLFNEWHAKNTSDKVRRVFQSKGKSGKPLTTNPPFGYMKNSDNGCQDCQAYIQDVRIGTRTVADCKTAKSRQSDDSDGILDQHW